MQEWTDRFVEEVKNWRVPYLFVHKGKVWESDSIRVLMDRSSGKWAPIDDTHADGVILYVCSAINKLGWTWEHRYGERFTVWNEAHSEAERNESTRICRVGTELERVIEGFISILIYLDRKQEQVPQ